MAYNWHTLTILLLLAILIASRTDAQPKFERLKEAGFVDPNTGYLYRVTSYNVTTMTTDATHRSIIKVSRVKLDPLIGSPVNQPEFIQTLPFHAPLVDFDLDCVPSHCYLAAVTRRTKKNVELYSWQRTQFDLQAKRDSFALPSAVQLFRIQSGFYIAVAQEQLHLPSTNSKPLSQEYEEPARFIGSAVFKFSRGQEKSLKYLQFIKLRFNPRFVNYFPAINPNSISPNNTARPSENHYLVFSIEPNWQPQQNVVESFIWSPLNDHFWPYRLPIATSIVNNPGNGRQMLKFSGEVPRMNFTQGQSIREQIEPVELCFHQLQRLLAEREINAKRLIDNSQTLWRSPSHQSTQYGGANSVRSSRLSDISARVIVHGDVIVKGSMIESPQISLIGGQSRHLAPKVQVITQVVDNHSPAIVENRLRQARYQLEYIRDKLRNAVSANSFPGNQSVYFGGRIKFYNNIQARQVIFEQSGVSNSDVRLNGLPFRQLERELVSLRGSQDIVARVIFEGNVVADLLEIHGLINDEEYKLRDAIDITSRRVQVIETGGVRPYSPPSILQFDSVSAPELILGHNATFNDIALVDFITRDNHDQFVFGRKSFKRLSTAQFDLANSKVLLNGRNISQLATSAIRLSNGQIIQSLNGKSVFTYPVRVKNLKINAPINGRINLTSIIYDSVKANEPNTIQYISGHKHFSNGLKIAKLRTEGFINSVPISQVFNLNPYPPVWDYEKFISPAMFYNQPPITGVFTLTRPVDIKANLNTQLINGIDITRRAIRRTPINDLNRANSTPIQYVSGRKIFLRPLRVLNGMRLLDTQIGGNATRGYPLINGFDFKMITNGIKRQIQNPSPIYIDNLDIDGNFHIVTASNFTGPPRSTLGNFTHCPLHHLRSKVVMAGQEEQLIDVPIRMNSLRARAVYLRPGALNELSIPGDFVLRSVPNPHFFGPNGPIEYVFGHKSFDRLIVSPPYAESRNPFRPVNFTTENSPAITFGTRSSVNNISYNEIQTFVAHESRQNYTGETIIQNLNVYGNIYAKRINGESWPDAVLLKSVCGNPEPNPFNLHKRIYSRLIFLNSSSLEVENQLVLRGPVSLGGRMNGVNLTRLAHQSVTYGDKELFSIGRPVRNKLFLGGLSVTGEVRSMGLIDGVNLEEMKRRCVTIGPAGETRLISAEKQFMADTSLLAPMNAKYFGNLPLEQLLGRINFLPGTNHLQVFGKKSITGTLKINKQLTVYGLINNINFADLKAKAIPLSPQVDQLTFNRTFTVEGDVFVDNLLINEKDGVIDGVKLTNLVPIETVGRQNEIVLSSYSIVEQNTTHGQIIKVTGSVQDCEITCNLAPKETYLVAPRPIARNPGLIEHHPSQFVQQRPPLLQQVVTYPPRIVTYQGRNLTYMRTTPPYATQPSTNYFWPQPAPLIQPMVTVDRQNLIQNLAIRRPAAITYEARGFQRKPTVHGTNHLVAEQINGLRKHMVSLNFLNSPEYDDLVVGFIPSPTNDISSYQQADPDVLNYEYIPNMRNFLLLDQVDYVFRLAANYHLSVGVLTDGVGQNVTNVYTSTGGGHVRLLSVLPVEAPNCAKFLKTDQDVLFLLISQDYIAHQRRQMLHQCPSFVSPPTTGIVDYYNQPLPALHPVIGGVHVYVFHSLQNSSLLNSAYFDLHQTIDLPAIDSFEKFAYRGSTYVVGVSRATSKIYLLLLRGYSGFQIVSHLDMPAVDRVAIIYTGDAKPTLLVYLDDGTHRLMDSVMI